MKKKQSKKVVVFSTCPKCGQAIKRDHDCQESRPDSAAIARAAQNAAYRRMISPSILA
jgi:hypothetical protein